MSRTYTDKKFLSGHVVVTNILQDIRWILFGRSERAERTDCAVLMAGIASGSHDIRGGPSTKTPIIGDSEDMAYLVGFYFIDSLRHRALSRLWMIHQFRIALTRHGLSNLEAKAHVAQFQTFYWIRMESLTWGAARRASRRRLQQALYSVYRLRSMNGQPALFL